MPVPHDIPGEREVWDAYAESVVDRKAAPSFCWTQYPGHGPGPEVLGAPRKVLEIGCGTGREVAYLAADGVAAHGVDLSPVMVDRATERWSHTGALFRQGEILAYLTTCDDTYDAVYSIFGAAWFTAPNRLFPLVRARLNPGGRFAFSQPPAVPGAYGPQGMYKAGVAGKATFTCHYSYRPAVWERLLTRAGFATAEVTVLDAPQPGHVGTLLVVAHT